MLDTISTVVSVIGAVVSTYFGIRQYRRRPFVHWFPMPGGGDNPDSERAEREFEAFMSNYVGGCNISTALFDNGNIQASGVKLFSHDCEFAALQYPHDSADSVFRGKVFPRVVDGECLHIFLHSGRGAVMYGHNDDHDAYLRVYWMDFGRNPSYYKQDFVWHVMGGAGRPRIETLCGPVAVGEDEYEKGGPVIDPLKENGFTIDAVHGKIPFLRHQWR